MTDQLAEGRLRDIKIERSCRVMLNPLAEIVLGMFMAVGIGGGQFMMDVLSDRERGECQQQSNKADRQARSKPVGDAYGSH